MYTLHGRFEYCVFHGNLCWSVKETLGKGKYTHGVLHTVTFLDHGEINRAVQYWTSLPCSVYSFYTCRNYMYYGTKNVVLVRIIPSSLELSDNSNKCFSMHWVIIWSLFLSWAWETNLVYRGNGVYFEIRQSWKNWVSWLRSKRAGHVATSDLCQVD